MSLPYKITTINGLKVLFYQVTQLPAIKAQLFFRSGSWYEDSKYQGISHFLEHLTCQKTKHFPNKLAIEIYKEEHGLSGNAFTSGDTIGYYIKAPNYSLKQALFLLNQFAFQPDITEDRFPKEISIITQEYKDYWDQPGNRFGKSIRQHLYGINHPYVSSALGEPDKISRLTLKEVTDHANRYLVPENALLTITGDFDLSDCTSIISEIFSPDNRPKPIFQKLSQITPNFETNIHVEDKQQDQIVIDWPLPGKDELTFHDRIRLNFASYLLGGSLRSVLYQNLREERGLVYRTGSHKTVLDNGGYFEIWCSTEPSKTSEAIKVMRHAFYNFVSNQIPKELYTRAKQYLDSSTLLTFDSLDSISNSITDNLHIENKVYLPEEIIRIASEITPDSVTKLLQKYLIKDKEILSIMTKDKTLKIE